MAPDDELSEDSSSRDTRTDEADAEGVWSADIEEAFQEALAIYPPCGRRKIILSDEGKMYGRNELIARYIKLRTGKARTRKQVSSHIQVLARRKAREIQSKIKGGASAGSSAPDSTTGGVLKMSAGGMPSTSAGVSVGLAAAVGVAGVPQYPAALMSYPASLWPPPTALDIKPFQSCADSTDILKSEPSQTGLPATGLPPTIPTIRPLSPLNSTRIRSSKLKLCEFSAFVESRGNNNNINNNNNNNNNTNSNGSSGNLSDDETKSHLFVHLGPSPHEPGSTLESIDIRQIYDKFPDKKGGLRDLFDRGPTDAFFLVKFWADLNISSNIADDRNAFYGVTSVYESPMNATISCSTKVCSFGKQVVEKVETEYPRLCTDSHQFVFCVKRSQMCEYVVHFIQKLKRLPEKYMMNSVLENFTILHVVSNRDTQETLLCVAYVFEVSSAAHGTQHHVYRLVKD